MMYIPRLNAEEDPGIIHAFIEAHPFATLVTAAEGLFATHLPLVLRANAGPMGTLEGHVARANPHHRRSRAPLEALVIFAGAHAHITPTWYPSKAESGCVVPTWNYIAVHAYGDLRFTDDPVFLRAHLARLTKRHETDRGSDWRTDDPPADYLSQQLQAIVGLEITIARLEGKWKMSQNRSASDIDGVVEGLRRSARPEDTDVADCVERRRPHRDSSG